MDKHLRNDTNIGENQQGTESNNLYFVVEFFHYKWNILYYHILYIPIRNKHFRHGNVHDNSIPMSILQCILFDENPHHIGKHRQLITSKPMEQYQTGRLFFNKKIFKQNSIPGYGVQ